MEHELWAWISRAMQDVARAHHDTNYHSHSTLSIVRTYLWAVLHDRPTSWACNPRAWNDRTRPKSLPSQSTMSRRLRSDATTACLQRLGRRLCGHVMPAWTLLKLIDGKPLTVARHSKDPDATFGRGAGGLARGYKLHAITNGQPMPATFEVDTLNVSEKAVARRMLPRLEGAGYLVADSNYDASDLFDLAATQGHRLICPRPRPGTGLGHHPQSVHRLRCIALLEVGPRVGQFLGTDLLRVRRQIETTFGNLTSFFAGLSHLPPWVRRLHRVRTYVHAKLIINAARIRENHA